MSFLFTLKSQLIMQINCNQLVYLLLSISLSIKKIFAVLNAIDILIKKIFKDFIMRKLITIKVK